MTGHVRKRGATWAYVLDVGRDPETGKRRQRWRSGFPRRKDAQEALTKALGQLGDGTYAEPTRQTVAEYLLDEWLPARRSQVRDSTAGEYERIIRTHIIPRIGGRRLQAVTPAMLNAMYGDLRATGGRKGRNVGGPLAPQTVRNVATVVHRAFRDACRWHKLVRNPADDADPPRAAGRRGHKGATWTAAELRRFLEHVQGDPLRALYTVAATTGARRGELLAMTWRRVDLEGGKVEISESVAMVRGEATRSRPKTDGSIRTIALDAETVRVLRELRREQAERRLMLGGGYQEGDLVFCHEDGSPLRPDTVTPRFQRLAKAAGVPVIRFHDLRHTWATLALQGDVHPKVVSERLGHASISFTLDTYTGSIPAMQADAADTVAGLIFGAG